MMEPVPVSSTGSTIGPQPQKQQKAVTFDLERLEPQTRARSNTWPLPSLGEYVNGNTVAGGPDGEEGAEGNTPPQQGPQQGGSPAKKNSSRRNAWGPASYAELITQAITSAPEQRLTLSQIYEWMVVNVPFFKNKGDNNSSAGWKNSIRHNLSLHSKFMRMQNEGTGKSSWWVINHNAKPGKSPRRRTNSMDTTKFTPRRPRLKTNGETLRNKTQQADHVSPTSSVGEGLDIFPDSPLHPANGFQVASELCPRTSSNASSGSQLSPIPTAPGEQDWTPAYGPSYSPEQLDTILACNLADTVKLESYHQMYQTTPAGHQPQTGPPPSYFETQFQRNSIRTASSTFGLPLTPQAAPQQRCPIHCLQPCACQMNLSPASGMSPTYQQSEPSPSALDTTQQQTLQYMMQTPARPQQPPQRPQPPQQPAQPVPAGASPPNTPTTCENVPSTMMGQLMGALNHTALNHTALIDDLNIEELQGGFDFNMDDVINHELLMGGTLDFNFHQGVTSTATIQVSDCSVSQNGAVSQNNGPQQRARGRLREQQRGDCRCTPILGSLAIDPTALDTPTDFLV